ncbi:MAG: ATP-binding cassette domain-containing protein [Treponema sp.]|nr:ATP-binding cassette domain-containing protein [Treponema sp.]MEE3436395.1 ATP-binding cassette domain-containing protein [Treponema sp.]
MSIQITKLNFSYPESNANLFEDFSLQIAEGWTCVAGSNGCGKSTLLKLIAGIIVPDSGKILRGNTSAKSGAVGPAAGDVIYCAQETAEPPENLYAAFWSDDNEARKFFSRLCVTEEMLERYETLSGGEKKRIQIACALAERPAVLLLDEPTNHLDAKTARMICEALGDFGGTGIIVSHDRAFADSLCARAVYLYNEAAAFAGGRDCVVYDSYPCGLTKALELRQSGADQSRGQWERLNAKAAAERGRSAALEAQNQKAKARLSKKAIDSRDHDAQRKIDTARILGKDRSTGDAKARLETQIRQTESERDSVKKALRRKEGFALSQSDYSKPLAVDEAVLEAGSYKLKIPRMEIKRGTKIALTGENGAGKSLFVRHVISLLEKAGRANEVLYLPQEISDAQRDAIFDELDGLEESERGEVLSTLYRLGSEPKRLEGLKSAQTKDGPRAGPDSGLANANGKALSPGNNLSPGELRKLMIALAVQKPLSLLVLDEPTNHMDITSVVALENALAALDCAMIVVSHDKAFLQKVCNASFVAERDGDQGKILVIQ